MRGNVGARARLHDDRAGDPLDGLVNLFDLGIVLSVAFLLAALSSIDLSPEALKQNRTQQQQQQSRPDDAVVVGPDDKASEIRLRPGEKVVGRGEEVGTVYRLEDGRTVLVRPGGKAPDGSAPGGGQPATQGGQPGTAGGQATPQEGGQATPQDGGQGTPQGGADGSTPGG
jgi:hypothetical protein